MTLEQQVQQAAFELKFSADCKKAFEESIVSTPEFKAAKITAVNEVADFYKRHKFYGAVVTGNGFKEIWL